MSETATWRAVSMAAAVRAVGRFPQRVRLGRLGRRGREPRGLATAGAADQPVDDSGREGFDEIIARSGAHELHRLGHGGAIRCHRDHGVRVAAQDIVQERNAVDSGYPDIEEDEIELLAR